MAWAASPRCTCTLGRTFVMASLFVMASAATPSRSPCRCASRDDTSLTTTGLTLKTGGSGSTFSTINCAAARACVWLSATTKPNTWPMCSTRSMAKTGSSWINVASSLSPGISSAVTTARTPDAASTARKSSDTMRPRATVLRRGAACSVPSVRGKSSMYAARPCTCRCALSCCVDLSSA